MTDMQSKGERGDTRRNKPARANDAQTMTVIDKWLAIRACTFEDAFKAIIEGVFYSWDELTERLAFTHLCHSNYCNLIDRERRDERTRLLAHATKEWQQGATIRSPMRWVLTFYENGLEAKWVSLIQHRSESLASYQNIQQLIGEIRALSEGRVQIQAPAIDSGRAKGGRDRHKDTFAYEVKRRISCAYFSSGINLDSNEQKKVFVRQMCEMYVDEAEGRNGLSKPKAGIDLKTMEPLKIRSRRTIENHIRSLREKRSVLAEHVVS